MSKEVQMLKTHHRLSQLGLSLGVALLVCGAAGSVTRASPLPTNSDEARALAPNTPPHANAVKAPVEGVISSTDEARTLAGYSLPISSTTAVSKIVTSTDEARAVTGGDRLVFVEIKRPEDSRAAAITGAH